MTTTVATGLKTSPVQIALVTAMLVATPQRPTPTECRAAGSPASNAAMTLQDAMREAVSSTRMALGHQSNVLYADDNADGANDGSTWCDAYVYLQDALAVAADSGGTITEISVAQGIYKPDQGANQAPGDRDATFCLMNGVAIRGGYAGCGAPEPNERDIEAYETVLTGDLNSDDLPFPPGGGYTDCCTIHDEPGCDDAVCEAAVCEAMAFCCADTWWVDCAVAASSLCCDLCTGDRCDNSYHVVTSSQMDPSAVLEGVVVTGGNAEGPEEASGAGILITEGGPTISACRFTLNRAVQGAGMFTSYSNPLISGCTFDENFASLHGGAMRNDDSEPLVIHCEFLNNSVQGVEGSVSGGAVLNSRSIATFRDCVFLANEAVSPTAVGGAMKNGNEGSTITIVNCVFIGNSSSRYGGAVADSNSDTTMTNCLFSGNVALWEGGAIHTRGYPKTSLRRSRVHPR